MASVTLQPITSANWRECIRLTVRDDQKNFVATNLYSLAEAAYESTPDRLTPLAVYDGATMIGFVMYGYPALDGGRCWFIYRLMVDQNQQGKGYGRAAMVELIKRIAAEPDCKAVYISYEPENEVADKLYQSLGFVSENRMLGHETLARLPIVKGV